MSSKRLHRLVPVVIGLALGLAGTAAGAVSGAERTSGSLDLDAKLSLKSVIGGCVPTGSVEECAARTITGAFPGLGQVTGSYSYLVDSGPPCPGDLRKALTSSIHLMVAGKGELHVAVAEAPCVDAASILIQTQSFTIVGGTGIYAGATGSGTLKRVLGEPTDSGRYGFETWTGTLSVPGLEFDVIAPTLSGATSKTVRAKRGATSARVIFQITAQDDRAEPAQVSCTPKSGSRFRIGKTKVTCDALDSSANAASASFTITVKKGR